MAKDIKNLIGWLKGNKQRDEARIVITGGRTSIDESYNRLKDNILYFGAEGKKIIQVESTISGEGKTSVVCNLAVSLSYNHKKVLVIDLDFRDPGIEKVFGIKEKTGLSDCILDGINLEEIITTTDLGVDVITVGREIHNSSYVLDSKKFAEIIANLKEKYDFILLDCPPVLLASDYLHIAKFSDGILYVVSANFVKKTAVRESLGLLSKLNVPVLGGVMTSVAKSGASNCKK